MTRDGRECGERRKGGLISAPISSEEKLTSSSILIPLSSSLLTLTSMDIDQDEPPDLVDTDESVLQSNPPPAPDPTATQMQDLSISKVPLTIITGCSDHHSHLWTFDH